MFTELSLCILLNYSRYEVSCRKYSLTIRFGMKYIGLQNTIFRILECKHAYGKKRQVLYFIIQKKLHVLTERLNFRKIESIRFVYDIFHV